MIKTAIFGGGCFWCTEAAFQMVRGIVRVMPGYAGGSASNPSYEQVCAGATGHAEVIKIEYDPQIVFYEDLLNVFFAIHNPTQLNRQGSDVGTQYRSIILFSSPDEEAIARNFIREHAADFAPDKIVTEVKPLTVFYPAEDYHHNYFKNNPDQAYCQLVISPKLAKFKEKYHKLLK